ncbi:MAG: 2-C-methyl-D-erythritol 2,4-cyclodiphosphate synthase [Clostridia bacterium]|nr:2-C-methyl-D-erythritol 2,4-cyclodiphosphate synthase [Clostridia bacterium]
MNFSDIRIGHGYDVHRLTEDRDLIIGGVKIPYEKGLLGHSDADVLVHAILDAILGALGEGDIGKHFPDTDERFKGINSMLLAENVASLLSSKGYTVGNIDATVVAQRPKLSPYIEDMRANIAKVFGVTPDRVNIKATTEEKLGFTGSGEGISAHAVCLIIKSA